MTTLTVDPSRVLRRLPKDPIGINLDYLKDKNANRPDARPIQEALVEMGAKWLRYPGGGKSDRHFWSTPPFEAPRPQVLPSYTKYVGNDTPLDFDEYVSYARDAGAAPYVVTAYDTQEHSGIPREEFVRNAVEWVRYANVKKRYGVKYWEIGNENWGNAGKGPPEKLAEVVATFSRAMKAVDPTILIGASGFNPDWWQTFLPRAAPDIDFLVLSNYPCSTWMGYDYYRAHPRINVVEQVGHAADAIAALPSEQDRQRLCVIVSELNSMDYAQGGWPNRNNLGHALVTVEIFGQALLNPKVRAALLWNTRWVEPEPETIWYALDPENRLLPAGRAVAVWGQFVRDTLVACDRTDAVVTFASRCSRTGELSVFLINKGHPATEVALRINGPQEYASARVFRFRGNGPDDMSPVWEEAAPVTLRGNAVPSLELPGVSLCVLAVS